MGLNASIILQGRVPQIDNPMDVMAKGMNLKQLANSNRAAEIEMEKKARMSEIMKKNVVVGPDGTSSFNQAGAVSDTMINDPEAAMAMKRQFDGHDLAKMEADTKKMSMIFASATKETAPAAKAQALKLGITNADKLPDVWTDENFNGVRMRTAEMKDQIIQQREIGRAHV